jgi:molybdopterin-guanine dinucleotide biosynthesis protein A
MTASHTPELAAQTIRALILAGGASSRMGADKAWMDYRGKPQVVWLYEQLESLGLNVWISLQREAEKLAGRNTVQDSPAFRGHGPLSGVLSAAQQVGADTAWLFIGCDYPLFGEREIGQLIQARDPNALATVFSWEGRVLPFPAIWEPEMLACLESDFHAGHHSLRRSLEDRADRLQVISPLSAESLQSADTPEAAAAIRLQIGRKAE